MNALLLAAAAPAASAWNPTCAIVMVVCNVVAIGLGKATMKAPSEGTALPNAEMFGGMAWPALLATTSFGHLLGIGAIVSLKSAGVI